MSRFEGDLAASGGARLGDDELRGLLAACSSMPGRDVRQAIACYLSAGEGWDEALKALRGAFASDAAAALRPNEIKLREHEINQSASEYLQWQALKPARTDND